ncbi:hypothetical protein LGM65_20770 [Burkholderia anthina]|uniref:hypothetical protein n=1 Tax=Burkholderia anthina TaxID=179879 RepID=UPI001CF12641|nr:hypothetical protein [Burkholderia anthina]MCA8093293.1 hypothetical protein [Burkholderia anthina]
MVDVQAAVKFARRHAFTAILAVVLFGGIFGAAGWRVWGEWKAVEKKRSELSEQSSKLDTDKVNFEKYRARENEVLLKQRLNLEKREFILSEIEKQNQVDKAALEKQAQQYSAAFDQLRSAQAANSQAERDRVANDRMEKLMSEFSAMGVNLRSEVNCNDRGAIEKYNSARAKYDEIVAFANANNLDWQYASFFNSQGTSRVGSGCL